MRRSTIMVVPAICLLFSAIACKPASKLRYQCSGEDITRSELPTTKACFVKVNTVLRMREAPGTKAKVTGVLPDNARVLPGERSGEVITIGGKKGRWTKVTYAGRSGWVFGGFLISKGREPHEMRRPKNRRKPSAACRKNYHSPTCVGARENRVMRNHPGLHSRRGNKLVLKLRNGKEVVLRDRRTNDDSVIIHEIRAYYADLALFYIEESYYEGGGYRLIDAKNGRKYKLSGEPFIAPSRKRIVTVDYDPHDAYGTNMIEVWAVRPLGLKSIYQRKFKGHDDGAPSFAGWTENRLPQIEMYHMDGGILRRFKLMETKSGIFKQKSY